MYNSYSEVDRTRREGTVPTLGRDSNSTAVENQELGVKGHQRQNRIPTAPYTLARLGLRI